MAHFHLSMKPQPRRKDGSKLSAKAHFNYIARQCQYAHMKGRQEDFVLAKSGNLPEWAGENAGYFWDQAESHRSPSGRAYREIELGLQEELSLEDNLAVLESFMSEFNIDKYAYTYAVHSKDSALETGHKNIHVHLMFNEKIQEPERILGPNQYFNAYSTTREGVPIGGYRSSREFLEKNKLHEMRKRWAEMVNEKFRERGIAAEVTEKNNADRYDELVTAGRYDEAELVNRTAAPHLGRAYRNDLIMEKIRLLEDVELARDIRALQDGTEDETDEAARQESDERVREFSEKSHQEQMITLYINDLQIRRLVRKLQQEKAKIRKAQRENVNRKGDAEDPVIITVGDVIEAMEKEERRMVEDAAKAIESYHAARRMVREEGPLKDDAIEYVLGSEWRKEKKHHWSLERTLRTLKSHLRDTRTPAEEEAFRRRNARVRKALVASQKRLAAYDSLLVEKKAKIESVYDELRTKNEEHKQEARKSYGLYKRKEKSLREFKNKRIQLAAAMEPDQILFAEKLAREVREYCKVYGIQPVRELSHDTFEGREYYLLGEPEWHGRKQEWHGRAIRIGDPMDRGKAPVYKVVLRQINEQEVAYAKVEATRESVPMYKARQPYLPRCNDGKFLAAGKKKTAWLLPKTAPVTYPVERPANVMREVSRLVAEATQSTNGKLAVRWTDDDRRYLKKTEMERVEQDLYAGWSL